MAVQNCMFNALLNLNSLNRKIANSISFDERNNCILRFNKIDIRLTFIDPFLYVYSQVYGGLDKHTFGGGISPVNDMLMLWGALPMNRAHPSTLRVFLHPFLKLVSAWRDLIKGVLEDPKDPKDPQIERVKNWTFDYMIDITLPILPSIKTPEQNLQLARQNLARLFYKFDKELPSDITAQLGLENIILSYQSSTASICLEAELIKNVSFDVKYENIGPLLTEFSKHSVFCRQVAGGTIGCKVMGDTFSFVLKTYLSLNFINNEHGLTQFYKTKFKPCVEELQQGSISLITTGGSVGAMVAGPPGPVIGLVLGFLDKHL